MKPKEVAAGVWQDTMKGAERTQLIMQKAQAGKALS
jgi:hypothetical protein